MSVDKSLTDKELSLLKRIARAIIPPVPADGLPGADDDQIFQRLIALGAEQADQLHGELCDLLSAEGGVSAVAGYNEDRFNAWMSDWAECWPSRSHAFFKRLMPLLLRAYYQDFRVHSAYDRRPGPPFPEGYVIIEGDWSLLDPVRERPPIFRRPLAD